MEKKSGDEWRRDEKMDEAGLVGSNVSLEKSLTGKGATEKKNT